MYTVHLYIHTDNPKYNLPHFVGLSENTFGGVHVQTHPDQYIQIDIFHHSSDVTT